MIWKEWEVEKITILLEWVNCTVVGIMMMIEMRIRSDWNRCQCSRPGRSCRVRCLAAPNHTFWKSGRNHHSRGTEYRWKCIRPRHPQVHAGYPPRCRLWSGPSPSTKSTWCWRSHSPLETAFWRSLSHWECKWPQACRDGCAFSLCSVVGCGRCWVWGHRAWRSSWCRRYLLPVISVRVGVDRCTRECHIISHATTETIANCSSRPFWCIGRLALDIFGGTRSFKLKFNI